MLTFVDQEIEHRNYHMAFPRFAGNLPLLVQNGQTDHYIWLGSLELNCSQDVFGHLHRVTVERFSMIVGTISLSQYPKCCPVFENVALSKSFLVK